MEKSLIYLSQTDENYKVLSAESGGILIVPKNRLKNKSITLFENRKFLGKYLKIAFFGLPLGGIFTVIFAPIVIWKNFLLIRSKQLSEIELIHGKNLLITSAVILFIGLALFALFIVHLIF